MICFHQPRDAVRDQGDMQGELTEGHGFGMRLPGELVGGNSFENTLGGGALLLKFAQHEAHRRESGCRNHSGLLLSLRLDSEVSVQKADANLGHQSEAKYENSKATHTSVRATPFGL